MCVFLVIIYFVTAIPSVPSQVEIKRSPIDVPFSIRINCSVVVLGMIVTVFAVFKRWVNVLAVAIILRVAHLVLVSFASLLFFFFFIGAAPKIESSGVASSFLDPPLETSDTGVDVLNAVVVYYIEVILPWTFLFVLVARMMVVSRGE